MYEIIRSSKILEEYQNLDILLVPVCMHFISVCSVALNCWLTVTLFGISTNTVPYYNKENKTKEIIFHYLLKREFTKLIILFSKQKKIELPQIKKNNLSFIEVMKLITLLSKQKLYLCFFNTFNKKY